MQFGDSADFDRPQLNKAPRAMGRGVRREAAQSDEAEEIFVRVEPKSSRVTVEPLSGL